MSKGLLIAIGQFATGGILGASSLLQAEPDFTLLFVALAHVQIGALFLFVGSDNE